MGTRDRHCEPRWLRPRAEAAPATRGGRKDGVKLACVVHRFGADIAGGSEAHCRHVAERLSAKHDVTVLTTCAKDHITWRNEYPAGESRLGPVRVHRFPVARQRSLHRFRGNQRDRIQRDGDRRRTGAVVPRKRSGRPGTDRVSARRTAASSTACCSGRFGTRRSISACRSSPTARPRADGGRRSGHSDGRARPLLLAAGRLHFPDARRAVARASAGVRDRCRRHASSGQGSNPAGPRTVVRLDIAWRHRSPSCCTWAGSIRTKDAKRCCSISSVSIASTMTPVQLVMAGPANMPMPIIPR